MVVAPGNGPSPTFLVSLMKPKEKRAMDEQPPIGARQEFLIDLERELVRLSQKVDWDAMVQGRGADRMA